MSRDLTRESRPRLAAAVWCMCPAGYPPSSSTARASIAAARRRDGRRFRACFIEGLSMENCMTHTRAFFRLAAITLTARRAYLIA